MAVAGLLKGKNVERECMVALVSDVEVIADFISCRDICLATDPITARRCTSL